MATLSSTPDSPPQSDEHRASASSTEREHKAFFQSIATPQATVLAAALAVVSGIAGAWIQGIFNRDSQLSLERTKLQTTLVLDAIKAEKASERLKRLKFFAKAGLIPDYADKVVKIEEESVPFIPTSDSADIQAYHSNVRRAIENGTRGYARSDVGGVLVSLRREGNVTSLTHAPIQSANLADIIQEMMLDVAEGTGIASPGAFARHAANSTVGDLRAFPESIWPRKHALAKQLEQLLQSHPELFD